MMTESGENGIGPAVGDAAPDVVLGDEQGEPRALRAGWEAAERGLVLVFFRHFG